jgi:predicted GTPase
LLSGVASEEGVGHGLKSETSMVNTLHMKYKGRNIVLVDTPGFDDTRKS